MHKCFTLAVCFTVVVLAGCSKSPKPTSKSVTSPVATKPYRDPLPAFKGMELYSWRPSGKDWQFSLLLGTNCTKSLDEITSCSVDGINNIKKKLSTLAVGESVFWNNATVGSSDRGVWTLMSLEPVPQEMIDDLTEYCKKLKIELHYCPNMK